MNHAAAQDLQPAGVLADPTTRSTAEDAVYVHLGAGFSEGEVTASEAHLALRAEHLAGELDQHALQVGHGDVPPHGQPLHLVELHLGAGGDLLVAIALAGQDDADGLRAALAHDPDLPRRGVGAQQDVGIGGVEGIPHVPRRVMGGHVEQLEVQLVRLHVRAVIDLEAHLGEDGVDLPQGLGGDVESAGGDRAARQGHIYPLRRQRPLQLLPFEGLGPGLVGGPKGGLHLVGPPTGQGPLLGRQPAHAPQQLREPPLPTQVRRAPLIQRRQIGHAFQLGQGVFFQSLQFIQHPPPPYPDSNQKRLPTSGTKSATVVAPRYHPAWPGHAGPAHSTNGRPARRRVHRRLAAPLTVGLRDELLAARD